MSEALTDRQRAILEFIGEVVDDSGYPPTVREMCGRFGISSPRGVCDHLKALERKGYIERESGKSRGIRLMQRTTGVPIVGRVAAGSPIMAIENFEGTLDMEEMFGAGDVFAVTVQGDSMIECGIHDGDYVVVRKTPTVENGTIAVAYIDGEATVKRIFRTERGYALKPENKNYDSIEVDEGTGDFSIAGPVVGVVRKM